MNASVRDVEFTSVSVCVVPWPGVPRSITTAGEAESVPSDASDETAQSAVTIMTIAVFIVLPSLPM